MLTEKFWLNLCRQAGAASDDTLPVLREITQAYDEPARTYHNLNHINYCLERLTECHQLAENAVAVTFAIIFHDAVYIAGAHDNELRSAELAKETLLNKLGVSAELASTVHQLILNTTHDHVPQTRDGQLLADIDLSGFAKPYDEFMNDGAAIRAEFSSAKDSAFYQGRKLFFQLMLKRKRIYFTDYFYRLCEQKARSNIKKALSHLGDRIKTEL